MGPQALCPRLSRHYNLPFSASLHSASTQRGEEIPQRRADCDDFCRSRRLSVISIVNCTNGLLFYIFGWTGKATVRLESSLKH